MKNIKTKIQKWVAENNAKILSERKKRFRQSQIFLKDWWDYADIQDFQPEVIDIYLGETSTNVYDIFGVTTHTKIYAEMSCTSCGQLQFKIIDNPLKTPVALWAPLLKWELQAEKHLIEEHSKWRVLQHQPSSEARKHIVVEQEKFSTRR